MIIVDSGEKEYVLAAFNEAKVEYVVQEIRVRGTRVGDFTNTDRTFLIEHKSLKDCYNSLMRKGRLYKQLGYMHDLFNGHRFLVVDCTLLDLAKFAIKHLNRIGLQNKIPGVIASIYSLPRACTSSNVHFVSSGSIQATVKIVDDLDRHGLDKPKEVYIKRNLVHDDERLAVISGIRGVGQKTGGTLLNLFGSVDGIVTAIKETPETVLGIPGIGPKTLARLKEVLL